MSRKGISAAEKVSRLLAFFTESESFFAIKDIERQGAKATGINSMQIKDVLQTLLDDGLVRCEKIGAGNYYWSFASDATRGREAKLESVKQKVSSGTETVTFLTEKLATESAARENTVAHVCRVVMSDRTRLLAERAEKEKKIAALNSAVSKYADCDPELHEIQKTGLSIAREATNRWTENILVLVAYFREQGTDTQLLYQEFGIPQDLDTV
ncbi:meiotic nuclear division protein 1 [Lipomyces arxii]|uniref:meiotic nuclear division protein 1 n=1 Tax=Lipomyces arxii TaxID=56418 RepID=UPI0034CE49D8